jgi:putative peptide maturation system protein
VTRSGEQQVLRVNDKELNMVDVMSCLDSLFDDRRALRTLIDSALVAEALEQEPVVLTDADLQHATDAFRRAKGLLTAERTAEWLRERALSVDGFLTVVERTANVAALRRRVAGPEQVRAHFDANRARYEAVVVAWAAGGAPVLAADPLAAVTEAWRTGRAAGVTEYLVRDLPAGMSAIGGADRGTTVPVLVGDDVPGSALVVERRSAELGPVTTAVIERELFDAWLAERRAAADIEWLWGDHTRTRRAA